MLLLRLGGLICLIVPLFLSQEFVFETIQDVSIKQMTNVTFEVIQKVVRDTSSIVNIFKAFSNNQDGILLIDESLKKNDLEKEFKFDAQLSWTMR